MKGRESWGEENYHKDMDFILCRQAEPTDEYGTVEEVYNAICYWDLYLEVKFVGNAEQMLTMIQKGMPNDIFERSCVKLELDDHHGTRKPADPQEIVYMVHHYLDWVRATSKRTWDSRGMNPTRQMFDACVKGLYLNSATHLHYDEDPKID
jgi:hypothetical protein